MKEVSNRQVVNPFRVGVKIPHLPEESAHQAPGPQGDNRAPVSFCSVLRQRAVFEEDVNRFEDKKDRYPDKREEVVRKYHK